MGRLFGQDYAADLRWGNAGNHCPWRRVAR